MKIKTDIQIQNLLEAVNKCHGDVLLKSIYNDTYNLKSILSRYLGIAALLSEHGEELELFCTDKNDEHFLFDFFKENPDVLGSCLLPVEHT